MPKEKKCRTRGQRRTCYHPDTDDAVIDVLEQIQDKGEVIIKYRDRPYGMRGFLFHENEDEIIMAKSLYDDGFVVHPEQIEKIDHILDERGRKKRLYPK